MTADPLTDPELAEPLVRPEFDPMAGHRAHMERVGQEQWVKDACARAFDRPIEEVRADLAKRRPAAKKAPAKKAAPPRPRP